MSRTKTHYVASINACVSQRLYGKPYNELTELEYAHVCKEVHLEPKLGSTTVWRAKSRKMASYTLHLKITSRNPLTERNANRSRKKRVRRLAKIEILNSLTV